MIDRGQRWQQRLFFLQLKDRDREREEERGEGIDCSPLDDDEGSFLSQKINAVLLSGRERKTRLRSFPPLLFPPQRKRIVPPAAPPLGVSGIGSREGPTSALRVTWPTLCQAVWVELKADAARLLKTTLTWSVLVDDATEGFFQSLFFLSCFFRCCVFS